MTDVRRLHTPGAVVIHSTVKMATVKCSACYHEEQCGMIVH